MSMIFPRLGIYGWREADEDLALASPLTGDPVLQVGSHGTAKTGLFTKIAEALGLRAIGYDASKPLFEDVLGYRSVGILRSPRGGGESGHAPGGIGVHDSNCGRERLDFEVDADDQRYGSVLSLLAQRKYQRNAPPSGSMTPRSCAPGGADSAVRPPAGGAISACTTPAGRFSLGEPQGGRTRQRQERTGAADMALVSLHVQLLSCTRGHRHRLHDACDLEQLCIQSAGRIA